MAFIEQENEIAACILINAGCSVDLPQKSSYESEVKYAPCFINYSICSILFRYPIHMACCLGLLTVVIKMLERKADVNIEVCIYCTLYLLMIACDMLKIGLQKVLSKLRLL